MPIMSPGVFPDTTFPDRSWIDDVWAEFGVEIFFIRGSTSFSDPLASDITFSDPLASDISYK